MSTFNEATAAGQSYLASALGFMQDVNWMAVGAGVLLVARLVQDVPKAIEAAVHYYRKWKNRDKGN